MRVGWGLCDGRNGYDFVSQTLAYPRRTLVPDAAITASNVDGFMGKRLGNLRKQRAEDLQTIDDDSEYTPQLDLVADTINAMNTTMAQVRNIWFPRSLSPPPRFCCCC